MQRAPRAGEIEGARLERKVRRVALDEHDVLRRAFASEPEQLGDDVDADDLADERRQCERQRARTGPAVDRPLISVRCDEGAQLLAYRLDLLPSVIRDALGRRPEARAHVIDVRARLRHRSPCGARVEVRSRFRTRAHS